MITVVFGDSIAKGIITLNNSIQTIKNNAAEIVGRYYNQKIINVSQYGQTVKRLAKKQTVDRFIEQVKKQNNKYAIISLGGNDSDFNWRAVAQDPEFNHLPKTPLKEFVATYEELIKKLKHHGFVVILISVFPIDSKRYFNNVIAKIADPREVLKFLKGDVEQISKFQETYNVEVIELAKKNDCILFDVRREFTAVPNNLDYMCLDGVHPNEEGYSLISRFIIDKINKTKEFVYWVDFPIDNIEQIH